MQSTEPKVINVEELPWHDAKGLPGMAGHAFGHRELLHDSNYTTAYSVSMARFAPGATAKRHIEKWNHTLFIMHGTGIIEIDGHTWPVTPGTLIKVKAGEWHSLSNTGSDDMTMLVIYDPPRPMAK